MTEAGASWQNIDISGEAVVHLGHSYNNSITNHIHITSTLARAVRRACIKSSSSFDPLSKDIASFRSILEMTEDAVIDLGPDERQDEHVMTVLSGCKDCLTAVQNSVTKYNELPVSSQRTWERMDWGAEEISDLQLRLGRNISMVGALNSTLTNSSQKAVKDMLLKFIHEGRTGRREGSIVSRQTVDSLTLDEREGWRELRKHLEDVGITPRLFTEHRDLITKTLQEAISSGLLQEESKLDAIVENDVLRESPLSEDESSIQNFPLFTQPINIRPIIKPRKQASRTVELLKNIFGRNERLVKCVELGVSTILRVWAGNGSDDSGRSSSK